MKKSIAIVAGVALLAGGYVAGSFIGLPNVDNSKLHGDVSKVNVFNNADDPEVQAAMEQLANDTTLQKQTAVAALLMSDRLSQIDSLVTATEKATAEIAELKPMSEALGKFSKRTGNACSAYGLYVEEAAKVMNGEKSDIYEQASNNALAAYTVVKNNLIGAKALVNSLTDYLSKNKNEELAKLTARWMQYCAEDAVLNGSKEDLTYWNDAYNAVKGNEQLGLVISPVINAGKIIVMGVRLNSIAIPDILKGRLDMLGLDATIIVKEINFALSQQSKLMMDERLGKAVFGGRLSAILDIRDLQGRTQGDLGSIFILMRQASFASLASRSDLSAFTSII